MLLEMKNITKDFGPVRALDQVSFCVQPGEVHGLLGENGAGKTTLMNVLAGAFPPSSGEIYIDGNLQENMTPRKSAALGIRFIRQELNLCNDLTVYENMFLGEELTLKFGFRDKRAMIDRAQAVLNRMNAQIDAKSVVKDLETAQKQLVEIAKALLFESQLIIMDEPTTALNNHEIESLFEMMRSLKKDGVSFIYISHKMPELFAICDAYTVMRDGRYIQSGLFSDIDERTATELLIGKTFVDANIKDTAGNVITSDVTLSVSGLCGETFHDVSFDLHRGEIIAVTGLQGAGSGELAEVLFGALPYTAGSITTAKGTFKNHSIVGAMRAGVAMVPRNRKERGILTDLSILDNTSMAQFITRHKNQIISKKRELARYLSNKKALSIKADNPANPITSLSGGNQQKVIIARWLETDADVYILDSPTQGIDVGAKYEIYKLIVELAKKGKSILVFSTEFPEIYKIADRCLVMYKGRINADIKRADLEESTVMYYSTGSNLEVKV